MIRQIALSQYNINMKITYMDRYIPVKANCLKLKVYMMKTKNLVLFIGLILVPLLFYISLNYKFFIITSGSMSPAIPTGSLVVLNTDDSYKAGDIISFKAGNMIITHRIVDKKNNQEFVTKGDANLTKDFSYVSEKEIMGKVILSIPYIGYIVLFIKRYSIYLLLLCAVFLLSKNVKRRTSWKSKIRKK